MYQGEERTMNQSGWLAESELAALEQASSDETRRRQGFGATARKSSGLACRVGARCVDVPSSKLSAFAKATARQSTLSTTLRA